MTTTTVFRTNTLPPTNKTKATEQASNTPHSQQQQHQPQQQQAINRTQSFVNSFKWWQGQNNNKDSNCSSSSTLNGILLHQTPAHRANTTFGSSVAVQKLRESKWFRAIEQRIFCAVVECGFIVEVRVIPPPPQPRSRKTSTTSTGANSSTSSYAADDAGYYDDDDDDDDIDNHQNENDVMPSWYGIVLCKTSKDNKAKPETIEIHSVKIGDNGLFKKIKMSLEDIWANGMELRINNFGDKEKQAHNEKDIRSQVSLARKAKHSLWNNNKHFAYWCRYGVRQQDMRKRHMSECVKWGSVGMNAGILLEQNGHKEIMKVFDAGAKNACRNYLTIEANVNTQP